MICFPNAKINIGLRILEKRPDGFHNIESVFYPVGWSDALEAVRIGGEGKMKLHLSGISLPGKRITDNLCTKLYKSLEKKYKLPSMDVWLHKTVPIGAGLGGGSSDAAHFMKMLNQFCGLNISEQEMKEHVAALGSDCLFFIENKPVLATGKGDITEPVNIDLSKYYISIIYPEILISTPFAYSLVKADNSGESLKSIIAKRKIGEWDGYVVNDFEKPIIEKFPAIAAIKDTLYKNGAIYASMSGSGSAVYGIFDRPMELKEQFPHYKIWSGDLKLPK